MLTWGLIEWALTGMLSMGGAMAAWVWHLAGRVDKLETAAASEREELDLMRKTIREIGTALDSKINEETERLEGRMDKVMDKVDEFRSELPSRQFIETQLNNLQGRLDRSMDVKMAGR